MDDFFLPPHLRTGQRRGQPGGNVHYERFSIQVAPRLPWREPFSYQRFDCARRTMDEWRRVPAVPVVFVEGAYALHPACRADYGLKVFFEVSPQLQQERIMKRNGPDQWVRFREEWIPMERLYQEPNSLSISVTPLKKIPTSAGKSSYRLKTSNRAARKHGLSGHTEAILGL